MNNNNQDVLNDGYRQPETVQLAPDALVYINGSNLLQSPDGDVFDIRQDITEISTSLNVDATPGTANFTISYPEHTGGRGSIKNKYANLMIMSEVVIYFRGRFQREQADKTTKFPYYQVFWGIISAITENYSDGVHTISVSCADILRWWQITNITINPSLLSSVESLKTYLEKNLNVESENILKFLNGFTDKDKNGRQISIFSNIFSNKTIPEIFQACAQVSMLQMMPVKDYLAYDAKSTMVGKDTNKKISEGQMTYWIQRLNQIGRNLRIYGLTTNNGRLDIDMTKLISFKDKNKNTTDELRKQVGNSTVVYQMIPNAPPVAKSDRKSQLDIANEIKEAIHFEFFMDVNGDIILKPPFYNLNVGKNTPNSIIHDVDIMNWNFVQSESEVITRVDVSGALSKVSAYNQTINGIAFDPLLALQFGERPVPRSMPWLHLKEQCLYWAKAELARQNALIRQGSMTIIGRPELRLGYPIYVPSRDAFYYVKGIDHRFNFGGTFTTTLTLVAERSKKSTVLGLFRNVGAITDDQIAEPGNSNAEPNETNNYIKQTFMPSICTPRAKEHVQVVQPNFTVDVTKVKSDVQGTWKTFANSVVEPGKDEFQITDNEGYEIVGQVGDEPYVTYGYGQELQNDAISSYTSQTDKSIKAFSLDVSTNELIISPNNVMLTLDDIDSRMINVGSTNPKDKGSQAQSVNSDLNKKQE